MIQGSLTTTETSNPSSSPGALTISGGSIADAGGLSVSGAMAWSGGSLSGRGITTVAGGDTLTIHSQVSLIRSALVIQGAAVLSDNSVLSLSQSASIVNNGSFTGQGLANGSTIYGDNNASTTTFTNNGTFTKTGSGRVAFGSGLAFVENKALVLSAGALSIGPSGTVSELYFESGSSVSGPGLLEISSGAIVADTPTTIANLSVTGGTIQPTAGLTVSGTMSWSGGTQSGRGTTTIAAGANLTITGSPTVQTGDLVLQGSAVLSDNSVLYLTRGAVLTNTGSFTTQALANGNNIISDNSPGGGTFVNDGTFTKTGSGRTAVSSGVLLVDNKLLALNSGTLTLGPAGTNGELDFEAGGSVSGTGLLQLEGGTIAVNTPTTIADISLNGGSLRPVAGLTVSGAMSWSGGTQSGRGTTTIATGANLTITGSATVQTGDLLVQGSTILSDNSTLSLSQGAVFTNSGSFTAQALANGNNIVGDGSTDTKFVNNGTFTKTGTGRTSLYSGLVLEEDKVLTLSTGTLTIGPFGSNSTLNFNSGSSVNGSGLLEVGSGGSLVANAPITIPELSFTGGAIYPNAGLTVSGSMGWSGGTQLGPGKTTIAASADLEITGSATVYLGDLVLQGSTVLSDNSTLSLQEGAIATNTGTFTAQALANGNSIQGDGISAFVNEGTFTKSGTGHTSINNLIVVNAKSLVLNAGTFTLSTFGYAILDLEAGGSISGEGLLELSSGMIVANTSTTILNLSLTGGALDLTPGASLTVGQWAATSGTVISEIASRTAYGSLHTTQPVDLSTIRLEIETIGSYLPQYHDTLHVLTAGSLTGPFASVGGETFNQAWTWAQAYSTTAASLIAIPPVPAAISVGQTFGGPGGLDSINPAGYWGEPVDSATGAFWTEQTDAHLAGLGIPFQFTRYYTSADTTEGPLGQGWSDSLDVSLSISGTTVFLHSENAQQTRYTEQPEGNYLGDPGARSVLTKAGEGWVLTRPDQTRMSFDSSGRLISMLDRNQIGLTLTYNASGQLSKATDSAGRVVSFTYNAANRLTSMSYPPSRTVHYEYDASNRLIAVTDAAGGVIQYTYDEATGLLATIKDPNGHSEVTNTYDSSGRVIKQVDAMGRVSTFAWNQETQTATLTDPRGKQWKDVYSGDFLQKQVDPLGDTTSYVYDNYDNLIARTSPRGGTTTMAYDEHGNLVASTAPTGLSYTQSWTYDQFNDITAHTDGRGLTTRYAYDARGNSISKTSPTGAKATYARDPITGAPVSSTNPLGHTTAYGYDNAGNLVKVTSPLGEIMTYGYDGAGRRTTMVDPLGNTSGGTPSAHQTTTAYNELDEVVGVTDPAGHTTATAYDATGNPLTRTDANGHTTSYTYNADNQLTKVTAPDGTSTTYTYDGDANRVSRTDGNGHKTSWIYDNANRLASTTTALGHTTTYSYNSDGARTKAVDAVGATTTTAYDLLDRPISVSYSDGTPTVTYVYNPNSQRISMTDGGGTIAYAYDNNSNLTKTTRGTSVFSYTYNADEELLTRTLPDSTVTTNAYDADGRLVTVNSGGGTTTYTYDPASEPIKTIMPGGVVESRTWEATGRLATIKALSGEKMLDSFSYTYDPVGNATQVVTPGGTSKYGYNARDRITLCAGPLCTNGSTSWTYNAVNLVRQTTPAGTTAYAYDADNQLITATGPGAASTTYHYDLDGRRTVAGTSTYTWDAANQLTGATVGGVVSAYTFDGDALRLTSTVGGLTTSDAWDVNNEVPQLVLERGAGNTLVRSYTYNGLGLVGITTPSGSYYYQHDSLQGIAGLTDSSGAAQWAYNYAPFGTTTSTKLNASAPANPMGYTGQYFDATGLYNLRARQLDPVTGQFLSPDPQEPSAQAPYTSTYSYAAYRPTVLVDPTGRCAQETSSWCAGEAQIDHYVSVYMHNFNLVRGVAQGALPSGNKVVLGWATDVLSSEGMPSGISSASRVIGPIFEGFSALKTVFNAFTAASQFE